MIFNQVLIFIESLGHRTLIDHVFVSHCVKPLIDKYQIVSDGSNLSDHLPVRFSMDLSVPVSGWQSA